ncbi:hypothetical protein [Streptomyces sp. SID11385]|uniref:hypothetical protein n=1 Tax=Streptomyces sp. SID11385 TaxID=2706031 RepID=UPI0013CD6537|nr:hypothetical protein [Streptomyces sp. SID11385]NEA40658.1 hypothetical protein [Streptomyces sp. SID11385]
MTTTTQPAGRRLTKAQKSVLGMAFVPMIGTGVIGALGTFSNISHAYGTGTALGAVGAGEGATMVAALVLLGLTMMGQSSPKVLRIGLWLLPAMAALMAASAAPDAARTVIYAVTPMGMTAAAEGMAFLARRIVVHTEGHDAEAQARAAKVIRSLAYHRARAANHPNARVQKRSEKLSWRLARKVGAGDSITTDGLLTVQRERTVAAATDALTEMFALPAVTPPRDAASPAALPTSTEARDGVPRHTGDTQVNPEAAGSKDGERDALDATATGHAPYELLGPSPAPELGPVTLADMALIAGVPLPEAGSSLTDEQLLVVLRWLRYSETPPLSYRQAATAFRVQGFVGGESRVRAAWTALMAQEESTS